MTTQQAVPIPEPSVIRRTPPALLVSVIVPTFGRADKIGRALASIERQVYDAIEVIVVDDNESSEDRATTAKAIAATDLRFPIRVIETTGRIGGGPSRNLGALAAAGEYVAFLDDDDEFVPDKISKQVEFMQVNNLDMSYQDVTWVDEHGRTVEQRRLDHATGYSRAELLRAHLLKPISPTAIYMIRRNYLGRTGGFGDVPVGQDWILMLRAIELGGKIMYMPGSFVHQSLHDGPRLSTGQRKLLGEKSLQQIREEYYYALTPGEQRLVDFRHLAVLAFASARSKFYLKALGYGARAFAKSPLAAFSQGLSYFQSRNKAAN